MKVKDVMAKDIVTVPPSVSIIDVARQMRDLGLGIIPVCENGRFRGIVTERDIVIGAVAPKDHSELIAGMLTHERYPAVSPGVDIMQAAKLMAEQAVRVLPVVENGRFVGLVTLEDLAQESIALAAMVFSKTLKPRASGEAGHKGGGRKRPELSTTTTEK